MRHVFRIDDGEIFWYSAETREQAFALFSEEFESDSNINSVRITQLPEDLEFSVFLDYPYDDPSPKETKTCREWAAEKEGLVATTLY
ncbi:MAG TPA: hypothetical protein PLP33_25945 [Leptospiraceae bacterium]|nr:hypothetical protein [Leptospiraceae bacterium]